MYTASRDGGFVYFFIIDWIVSYERIISFGFFSNAIIPIDSEAYSSTH